MAFAYLSRAPGARQPGCVSSDPREENPGRRTWAASYGLLAAYSASAAATAVAAAGGGTHRPGFALGLLALAASAVGLRATVPVALATGGMGWLFYAGFITGRHAQLAWQGTPDIWRLAILTGAALCGTAASAIHARAKARRQISAQPGQAHQAPVVVSLADARAARRRPPVALRPGR
jgi:hypothetical protein